MLENHQEDTAYKMAEEIANNVGYTKRTRSFQRLYKIIQQLQQRDQGDIADITHQAKMIFLLLDAKNRKTPWKSGSLANLILKRLKGQDEVFQRGQVIEILKKHQLLEGKESLRFLLKKPDSEDFFNQQLTCLIKPPKKERQEEYVDAFRSKNADNVQNFQR
ncbi:hypothetical protein [Facilibium subflavum]|uniref:hypothetical protein n=1 Tax=Facilibium subflavum TaxID=2219058 RepID=UPI000E65507E|nr:hypothetical protein [Facilibium subflavum]